MDHGWALTLRIVFGIVGVLLAFLVAISLAQPLSASRSTRSRAVRRSRSEAARGPISLFQRSPIAAHADPLLIQPAHSGPSSGSSRSRAARGGGHRPAEGHRGWLRVTYDFIDYP